MAMHNAMNRSEVATVDGGKRLERLAPPVHRGYFALGVIVEFARTVVRRVLRETHQLQILRPIIRSVMVQVMYVFRTRKGPAQRLLQDVAVLGNISVPLRRRIIGLIQHPVSIRVDDLSQTLASVATGIFHRLTFNPPIGTVILLSYRDGLATPTQTSRRIAHAF